MRVPRLSWPEARRIGVISDTHGLLRPEAAAALAGSDVVLHAGDVGRPSVLEALAEIAPVLAVRGNVDRGEWATALPSVLTISLADGLQVHLLHDLAELAIDPAAAGLAAVIFGHSHHAAIETRHGVFLLNPGSAGPRRFRLPVTVAHMEVDAGRLTARLEHLPT